ncbi:MAG: hypothetical protein MZV65_39675 [Chromatiales bacterium]|nr:hypothetical protein [Chromatiales bacterium]MCK7581156.1 hypothetical protein [Chromatiales bacterium]
MIPPFDQHGLLPPGTWDCTLEEVHRRFCWNPRRVSLFNGLQRFLNTEFIKLPVQCPIYIDGSFVRNKWLPSDIDIVLELSDIQDVSALGMATLLCIRRESMRRDYNLDIWARHPDLPRDLTAYFQYIGTKAEAELRLPAKHPKGILRIKP